MIKFKSELFETILKATQDELLVSLPTILKESMNEIVATNDYILGMGDIPVLLVAHLDTVHKEPIIDIIKNSKTGEWSSPQGIGGDDRCGVYMILELLKNLSKKPYVLFTTDEEIGCIGVKKFLDDYKTNDFDIKFMIEFDRKGFCDAVFYDCENEKFQNFIEENTNYITSTGAFTDICDIMETWDIAGVNLSCGYYKAHTLSEYIVINEMMNTIRVSYSFLELLNCDEIETFEAELYDYGANFDYTYTGSYWNSLRYGDNSSEPTLKDALKDCYYGTFDGIDYYICECGDVVDEHNFIENDCMCGRCYDDFYIKLYNDDEENESKGNVIKLPF